MVCSLEDNIVPFIYQNQTEFGCAYIICIACVICLSGVSMFIFAASTRFRYRLYFTIVCILMLVYLKIGWQYLAVEYHVLEGGIRIVMFGPDRVVPFDNIDRIDACSVRNTPSTSWLCKSSSKVVLQLKNKSKVVVFPGDVKEFVVVVNGMIDSRRDPDGTIDRVLTSLQLISRSSFRIMLSLKHHSKFCTKQYSENEMTNMGARLYSIVLFDDQIYEVCYDCQEDLGAISLRGINIDTKITHTSFSPHKKMATVSSVKSRSFNVFSLLAAGRQKNEEFCASRSLFLSYVKEGKSKVLKWEHTYCNGEPNDKFILDIGYVEPGMIMEVCVLPHRNHAISSWKLLSGSGSILSEYHSERLIKILNTQGEPFWIPRISSLQKNFYDDLGCIRSEKDRTEVCKWVYLNYLPDNYFALGYKDGCSVLDRVANIRLVPEHQSILETSDDFNTIRRLRADDH